MLHAGFLDKAVGEFSIFRRRWCVLLSTGLLIYYRQEDFFSVKYRGEIDLKGGEIRVFASNGPKQFSVHTASGQKLRFRALENEERDVWTRLMGTMIALAQ